MSHNQKSLNIPRSFLFLLISLTILIVWGFFYRGFIFDDSYISYRFADNLAMNKGLVWNGSGDRVEGFTNTSIILLAAVAKKFLELKPEVLIPFLGMLSFLVLIGIVLPGLARVGFKDTRAYHLEQWLILLACGFNPIFALHAFTGMETMPYSLLLCSVALAILGKANRKQNIILVILSFLAFLTRPDAIAFLTPLWIIRIILADDNSERKHYLKLGFMVLLLITLFWIFRGIYFGAMFPNTYYIKSADSFSALFPGKSYVKTFLKSLWPVWLYLVYAIGSIGFFRLIKDRTFACLFIPSMVFIFAYLRFKPMMGFESRFLMPVFPLLVASIIRAWGLKKTTKVPRTTNKNRYLFLSWGEFTTILVLSLLLIQTVNTIHTIKRYPQFKKYFSSLIQDVLVKKGKQLAPAAKFQHPPLLATGDIGAIPYYSKLPTMDLIGLADHFVAHNGLTHAYFSKRKPDLLILQDVHMLPHEKSQVTSIDFQPLDINGVFYVIDELRYQKIADKAAYTHSGLGSTYQVLTVPGFNTLYDFMGIWATEGSSNGYWIFLRKSYIQYQELKNLIKSPNRIKDSSF